MRPVWKYSMANHVWITNQTQKLHQSTAIPEWMSCAVMLPNQGHRAGSFPAAKRPWWQRGFCPWCQANTHRVVKLLGGVVHSPPVRRPLPGIPHHVVEAVSIGRKGRDLHRTGNTALKPHQQAWNPHTSLLKVHSEQPQKQHQISSAALGHFCILHVNQTGRKAVSPLCPQHPVPVWHSIPGWFWRLFGTVWPADTPGIRDLTPLTAPRFPSHKEKPGWLPAPACADSSSDETFGFT